jgi:ornithine carbamoyltransferase
LGDSDHDSGPSSDPALGDSIGPGMARNFLSIDDLTPRGLADLLELSAKVKASPSDYAGRLAGLAVAMVFEKPSTRTRVSFEVALASLGAHPVALSSAELQLGRGETIEDTGRVLSRYVDGVVFRTFGQERLEGLARTSTVPVVNALSDFEHPCQCLADLFTVREKKGELAGLTLGYVGDGNNVAHSLLLGGAKAGMTVRVATPLGYEPIPQVVQRANEIGEETGGAALVSNDPLAACDGADVLYTDVWASMGQEEEAGERTLVFGPYRLDAAAVARAADDAIVMHCLPAHRGQEITDEVIDGPQSVVWDQAENRLHTQKALLLWLFDRA